ncbi:hypothetical protein DX933_16150 [Ornithinibacillus gellani]|uniref:DUF6904 family protein n=1 Tax=Ornithinibacillus gellani TaxID=2293253 RepID=UPI000F48B9F1|nr:hypothetical protein [Ornithinibacillus gellani]TQS71204.1 hypothetical protein DX933_16150 [Ornithinibacillus gellani]
MIQIKLTPNYAGMEMVGTRDDFELLYESLHFVVGEEDEYPSMQNARLRVLGLCYDLRHAMMGHREYEYVNHGLDSDTMKWMGIVGPEKNLLLSFNTYYPEMIFIHLCLEDFIKEYQKSNKTHPNWDIHVNAVRLFQASVVRALRDEIKPSMFRSIISHMKSAKFISFRYMTQYLDSLNIRYLNWDAEKRLKNISVIVKRIAVKDAEYIRAQKEIIEAAIEYGVTESEIAYDTEYPDYDSIDW